MLVLSDSFYSAGQLLPEEFVKKAANQVNQPVTLRLQSDYDHNSYYCFIATFTEDHLDFHGNNNYYSSLETIILWK